MFEQIIGNEKNKELLKKIVETNNVSHSYMFIGQAGIGKMLFAKEFAKAILCTSEKIGPCNTCKSCIKFEGNNNPDIEMIDTEETIKNEQVREIKKKSLEKPIESRRKVYIINNSENMTREAQNSLLKTLEEPPEYITIILITKNENLLLNTIKSRCTKIKFNKLTNEELNKILKEKFEYQEISKELLELFDGSIEKALKVKGKEEIYTETLSVFSKNLNIIDLLKTKETIFKDKEEIEGILEYINTIFYKQALKSSKYINCIKLVEETKERLNKNSNYDMTIDNFLFRIWEEING